jgi:hypothetical protein
MYKPEETEIPTNEAVHVDRGQDSESDFEDVDFFERFETHRRTANNYLNSYFECLIHSDNRPGLNRRSLNLQSQRPGLTGVIS